MRGNSNSGVPHPKEHLALLSTRAQRDPLIVLGILPRIIQKVDQRGYHGIGISVDQRKISLDLHFHLAARPLEAFAHRFDRGLDDSPWFYRANLECVTWGRVQQMTAQFYAKYCDEAWAILSPEMLKAGKSLEGFDLAQLQADLTALKG